jgi:hypothetical protein
VPLLAEEPLLLVVLQPLVEPLLLAEEPPPQAVLQPLVLEEVPPQVEPPLLVVEQPLAIHLNLLENSTHKITL